MESTQTKLSHQLGLSTPTDPTNKENDSHASQKNIINDTKDQNNSSSEEESEDEGSEIEFPRENATDLFQFLHREINNLSNLEDN